MNADQNAVVEIFQGEVRWVTPTALPGTVVLFEVARANILYPTTFLQF